MRPCRFQVNWCKVRIARAVLSLGYNVHVSDVDVMYIRDVPSSYHLAFLGNAQPDAIFMTEDMLIYPHGPHGPPVLNLLNTGAFAVRSTNASLRLMDDWLGEGHNDGGRLENEQQELNRMSFRRYALCSSAPTCAAVRMHTDQAAVLRHPPQFSELQPPHSACPPDGETARTLDMCHINRLFVHAICRKGWGNEEGAKGHVLTQHSLWLVDPQGRPLYEDYRRFATALQEGGAASGSCMMDCYPEAWATPTGGAAGGSTGGGTSAVTTTSNSSSGGERGGGYASGSPSFLPKHPYLPCSVATAWHWQ